MHVCFAGWCWLKLYASMQKLVNKPRSSKTFRLCRVDVTPRSRSSDSECRPFWEMSPSRDRRSQNVHGGASSRRNGTDFETKLQDRDNRASASSYCIGENHGADLYSAHFFWVTRCMSALCFNVPKGSTSSALRFHAAAAGRGPYPRKQQKATTSSWSSLLHGKLVYLVTTDCEQVCSSTAAAILSSCLTSDTQLAQYSLSCFIRFRWHCCFGRMMQQGLQEAQARLDQLQKQYDAAYSALEAEPSSDMKKQRYQKLDILLNKAQDAVNILAATASTSGRHLFCILLYDAKHRLFFSMRLLKII